MTMPNRTYSSQSYRYGFNGMEVDDEVTGSNSHLDFGARIYDSRLGRWLSRDKKNYKQPSQSAYKAFLNNPNVFVDPDGNTEFRYYDDDGNLQIEIVDDGSAAIFELKTGSISGIPDYLNTYYQFVGWSAWSLEDLAHGSEYPVGTVPASESRFINVESVVAAQAEYAMDAMPQTSDGNTYCNRHFSGQFFALTGIDGDEWGDEYLFDANNIYAQIDEYKWQFPEDNGATDLFDEVTWDEARDAAESGSFVVVVAQGKNHGHVSVLDSDQIDATEIGTVKLLNVGSDNGEMELQDVWNTKQQKRVKFYVLNDDAVTNRAREDINEENSEEEGSGD